jgi:P63C domain
MQVMTCIIGHCKEADHMTEEAIGRAKGGAARALALTPERRKEISQKGVDARRERAALPKAICGDESRKLVFGDIEIQCYVLEDETRVMTMRSFQSGMGMSEGGGKGGARKIPALMSRLETKGIDIMGLDARANNPIRFILPSGGVADGYDARMLPDICAVLIEAERRRVLDKRYSYLAERAAKLQHGFATMGIIWLVDKVTGYEDFKKASDFGRIIEAFVAKELQPYVSKFPPEYYAEICRLRKIPYDPKSVARPPYFGHLTNNITYRRLAPGVWKELKEKAKKVTTVAKPHLHRLLTGDVGDPRLRDIISKNVAVMQLSDDWFDFLAKLDRVLPLQQQIPPQLALQFDSKDTGTGL